MDTSQPVQGDQPKHAVSRLLMLLLAIVVIAGTLALVWSFIPDKYKMRSTTTPLGEMNAAMRSGDLENALAIFRAIKDDPRASSEEKARSALLALGAEYRISGDQTTLVSDVRSLKQMIVDESVPVEVRARLISALAAQYSVSGNDDAVFAEIFADAPFNQHLVAGETDRSIKNLYEWSHMVAPTSYAAINIARWHSRPAVPSEGRAWWTMSEASATETQRYIAEADLLAAEEVANEPWHIEGSQYFWYRYWRAVVTGRLADKLDEPYSSQYRSEYDEFIAFAVAHKAALAKEALPFARFEYAIRLLQDTDADGARRQLGLLAQDMRGLPFPDANPFILFVRNAHASAPDGNAWQPTAALTRVSSEFKTAVEGVVGSNIE